MNGDEQEKEKYQDITSKCVDCGKDFVFTAGEQDFFNKHELYQPKRCNFCRKKKRKEIQEQKNKHE